MAAHVESCGDASPYLACTALAFPSAATVTIPAGGATDISLNFAIDNSLLVGSTASLTGGLVDSIGADLHEEGGHAPVFGLLPGREGMIVALGTLELHAEEEARCTGGERVRFQLIGLEEGQGRRLARRCQSCRSRQR